MFRKRKKKSGINNNPIQCVGHTDGQIKNGGFYWTISAETCTVYLIEMKLLFFGLSVTGIRGWHFTWPNEAITIKLCANRPTRANDVIDHSHRALTVSNTNKLKSTTSITDYTALSSASFSLASFGGQTFWEQHNLIAATSPSLSCR